LAGKLVSWQTGKLFESGEVKAGSAGESERARKRKEGVLNHAHGAS